MNCLKVLLKILPKNKGHLNLQKNRRYSNPGTSDFCLFTLTWLIDSKGCFIIFWQILQFCSCSMNQSARRKKRIAIWQIKTKVIAFFIQLIQALDFPLFSLTPLMQKLVILTVLSIEHQNQWYSSSNMIDAFSPQKIFCKFLVVKSRKKIPTPLL